MSNNQSIIDQLKASNDLLEDAKKYIPDRDEKLILKILVQVNINKTQIALLETSLRKKK